MKNSLNRFVPDGMIPFQGASTIINQTTFTPIPEIISHNQEKMVASLSCLFDIIPITDSMTLSFHHHLRNGDYVMNMVFDEIKRRNLKNITIAPSSIFPTHARLAELIEAGNVTKIYTNYLNGPVAKAIGKGYLKELLVMETHGGRARSIMAGDFTIDVCFAAASCADYQGNANGTEGKSACGSLGYILPDISYAKTKVIITDLLTDHLDECEIDGKYIDYVLKVDKIGEQEGIVSGTTQITRDPIGLKIAKDTARLLDELGLIHPGFSMQTGAGGISLAVTAEVKKIMLAKNIKASFASGGITGYFVDMLESGLIESLYDVQCFDLEAVRSYKENKTHYGMSSSQYANPYDNPIVNQLDFVILGATEIDVDFNVNVTTSSIGEIMGGSGGHADASHGAHVTVITTQLIKSRLPIIKKRVTTITTPGEDVDVLVTERGIAINPKRLDLLEKLRDSQLPIVTMETLLKRAHHITGEPATFTQTGKVIGVVKYRDGSIIDSLYQYNE